MSATNVADGNAALWSLWRGVLTSFGPWRIVRMAVTSPAIIGVYSVDFASSLRRTPMGVEVFSLLSDVTDSRLVELTALADLNVQRNVAMWRLAVIFYVSVPVTLGLAAIQAVPGAVRYVMHVAATPFWIAITGLVLFMLYAFLTQWRAQQVRAVLELVRIERMASVSPAPKRRVRKAPQDS